MTDTPKRYLTTREVAEEFETPEDTVRYWLRTGKMKARKLGGKWKILRADVEAFATASSNQPQQPAPQEVPV